MSSWNARCIFNVNYKEPRRILENDETSIDRNKELTAHDQMLRILAKVIGFPSKAFDEQRPIRTKTH